MSTLRGLRTLVLASVCLSTGCFRWTFDAQPKASFRKPIVQSTPTGGQLALARGEGDSSVLVTTQPMCRSMRTGRRVTAVESHRRFSGAWLISAIPSLIVGGIGIGLTGFHKAPLVSLGAWVPLTAYGLSTLIMVLANPDLIKRRVIRDEPNAAEWAGPDVPCGPATPAPGIKVHFQTNLQNTGRFTYAEVLSDAGGMARWNGFAATAARVAAFCGTATVSISETVGVANANQPPTAPFLGLRRAEPLRWQVPASSTRSLDGLHGGDLTVAQECRDAQIQACVNSIAAPQLQQFQLGCEEECGTKVDALMCVFGRRNCSAQAGGNQADQEICNNGFRQCMLQQGIAPDVFLGCVQTCTQARKKLLCP